MQLIANLIRFFVRRTIAFHDGNKSVFISMHQNILPINKGRLFRSNLKNRGLCQMVLMTSKTSLQKWSGLFLFPAVSPAFLQIGTVTYQHRLRFRWRGFMYEFLPLIRKSRTRCDLTGFHLASRSAQVLSLGMLALAFEQTWCSRAKRSVSHLVSIARSTTLPGCV
ncbi:hypothetical protein ACTQ44_02760 [Ligilactobacillus ruminis]|uniref:hypothetical protein n=1 Tax=Ligilactobacillus ruminis TaxID=1623 RepID=UPI003F992722